MNKMSKGYLCDNQWILVRAHFTKEKRGIQKQKSYYSSSWGFCCCCSLFFHVFFQFILSHKYSAKCFTTMDSLMPFPCMSKALPSTYPNPAMDVSPCSHQRICCRTCSPSQPSWTLPASGAHLCPPLETDEMFPGPQRARAVLRSTLLLVLFTSLTYSSSNSSLGLTE